MKNKIQYLKDDGIEHNLDEYNFDYIAFICQPASKQVWLETHFKVYNLGFKPNNVFLYKYPKRKLLIEKQLYK